MLSFSLSPASTLFSLSGCEAGHAFGSLPPLHPEYIRSYPLYSYDLGRRSGRLCRVFHYSVVVLLYGTDIALPRQCCHLTSRLDMMPCLMIVDPTNGHIYERHSHERGGARGRLLLHDIALSRARVWRGRRHPVLPRHDVRICHVHPGSCGNPAGNPFTPRHRRCLFLYTCQSDSVTTRRCLILYICQSNSVTTRCCLIHSKSSWYRFNQSSIPTVQHTAVPYNCNYSSAIRFVGTIEQAIRTSSMIHIYK